jgi:hypothetical protein
VVVGLLYPQVRGFQFGGRIRINHGHAGRKWVVALTIDRFGECKSQIVDGDGEELDPRQVLNETLEPLFFQHESD